jgi:hypothetical protein
MIFTNAKSQNSYIGTKLQQTKPANPSHNNANIFSILMNQRPKPYILPPPSQPIMEEPKTAKKMKWGEPTWYFLHCLAEKIKDDAFPSIRLEILNVIYTVCANLPCPDCANHASEYLKSINYKMIQTKEQLKNVLFSFHNSVNNKKNLPIFPRDQLEEKYRNMEFIPVIYTFMTHFQDKHKSIRMIANDFYRSRISEQMKIWLNANIQLFDK